MIPIMTFNTPTSAVLAEVDHLIHSSIQTPGIEIISLLFPRVVTDASLAELLRRLTTVPSIQLEQETSYGDLVTIALRVAVNPEGSLSWLMGFGPFSSLPKTRQAPITEIAVRCKPKPEKQFHRLNHDPGAAHLADYPVQGDDVSTERIWQATLRNTRDILGGEPDHFAAAKVTFTLPKAIWDKAIAT